MRIYVFIQYDFQTTKIQKLPTFYLLAIRSQFRSLFPTSRYLAVYRALKKQGRSLEDAGRLIYEMSKTELKATPRLVRRLIGYFWFSPWFFKRLKKRTKESQERKYPGGYVLTFVEGDRQDFDYGIDYTECASCKFLNAQDAWELAPYVCAVDQVASEMLGWGLSRTMTLAEGGEKCDFRFKKGGKTRMTMPPSFGNGGGLNL